MSSCCPSSAWADRIDVLHVDGSASQDPGFPGFTARGTLYAIAAPTARDDSGAAHPLKYRPRERFLVPVLPNARTSSVAGSE
jgi:hypothetical protein